MEDFIIDNIIDHRINRDQKHQYEDDSKTIYRLRWNGIEAKGDTWEPIRHLQRSSVLSYWNRNELLIRENIDEAHDG